MDEENVRHQGSSPLFAIFCISLLTLFLIPYTLMKICGGEGEKTAKAVKDKKQKSLGDRIRALCTTGNMVLLFLWLVWVLLVVYIQTSQTEMAPFDPFEIMQIDADATEQQVKKKYRKLARETHPDKNPDDPQAAEKFDLLVKAYKALTDEVSRENWKKYGHPDGPQAMNIGVAMPSFLFNSDKDTAPFMLLALVGFGILLPLVIAACYLTSNSKYAGPNQVHEETLSYWFHHPKFSIKESQGLRRIPDTLVVAMDFIDLPVPSDQGPALEELKRLVTRFHPDLKDTKKDFWKRKSSIVKVHMLLLAFLERIEDEVPEILKADLKFVLQRCPPLLAELMNVAVFPRKQYFLYGWVCPAVAVVEMMQCLTQAVPIRIRKPALTNNSKADKGGEALAALLQLPGMDSDVAKKLGRKKIRTLADLIAMEKKERCEALQSAGYTDQQLEDVTTFLAAMPNVHAETSFEVEGHPSVMEGDMITANIRVALTRPSHASQKVEMDAEKVTAVEAYSPHYPIPREEKWYFLLADTTQNILMSNTVTSLVEAENAGASEPEKYLSATEQQPATQKEGSVQVIESKTVDDDEDDDLGDEDDEGGKELMEADEDAEPEDKRQLIKLKFMAPPASKYNLQLIIMSDCWIGCDKTINVQLVVEKLNRAEREARDNAVYSKPFDDSDDDDDDDDGDVDSNDDASDYDSEETGTDVSDDEEGDRKAECLDSDSDEDDSGDSMPDLVHVSGDDVPGIDSQGNVKK